MSRSFNGVYTSSVCVLALAVAAGEPAAIAAPPPPAPQLRGVFVKTAEPSAPPGPLVGRLAIRYKGDTVPIERAFHDGDEIRFEITSNRGGWVFVFHRGPTGATELLWPAPGVRAVNQLLAGTTRLVPDDGTIVFDRETGGETFFVVISPVPDRPEAPSGPAAAGAAPSRRHADEKAARPKVAAAAADVPSAPAEETRVRKQILVRSPLGQITDDLDAGVRGVSFRPDDGDRYVYFTVDAKGATRWAIATFRLQHAAIPGPAAARWPP